LLCLIRFPAPRTASCAHHSPSWHLAIITVLVRSPRSTDLGGRELVSRWCSARRCGPAGKPARGCPLGSQVDDIEHLARGPAEGDAVAVIQDNIGLPMQGEPQVDVGARVEARTGPGDRVSILGPAMLISRLYLGDELGDELDLRQLLGACRSGHADDGARHQGISPSVSGFPALGPRPPMPAASSRPGLAT
jgi:hypothetical protein